ncbi:hypothetical protein C8024_07015 [Sphingopyxis sp. BSNA05]|nr:hypothetical protein [Sphingopyxis sp. BSNA05]
MVHRIDLFPKREYPDTTIKNIFQNRTDVLVHIKQKVSFTTKENGYLNAISFYYLMRCNLIHERATADVSDADIANFRHAVTMILKKLFNIKL